MSGQIGNHEQWGLCLRAGFSGLRMGEHVVGGGLSGHCFLGRLDVKAARPSCLRPVSLEGAPGQSRTGKQRAGASFGVQAVGGIVGRLISRQGPGGRPRGGQSPTAHRVPALPAQGPLGRWVPPSPCPSRGSREQGAPGQLSGRPGGAPFVAPHRNSPAACGQRGLTGALVAPGWPWSARGFPGKAGALAAHFGEFRGKRQPLSPGGLSQEGSGGAGSQIRGGTCLRFRHDWLMNRNCSGWFPGEPSRVGRFPVTRLLVPRKRQGSGGNGVAAAVS